MTTLFGRRVLLRPLVASDFPAWREVRQRNADWLLQWEPQRIPKAPDPVEDREAFAVRCSTRHRERQLGTAHGFGIFVEGQLCGEINLSAIQRGPFQSAYVGYWIDEKQAGNRYMPESVVVLARYAFDDLHLHRIQISIIPRNRNSRRVMEKLGVRDEGLALRYLEINGVWEDHVRYAMTVEEWAERGEELLRAWVE